jgi:hypothetical protein
MSSYEPVSLSTITDEISKVMRDLRALGVLPDDRDRERARLIDILEHVSGIVTAAAECEENGEDSFVPRWLKE